MMPFSFISLIRASSLATLAAASIFPDFNTGNALTTRLRKREAWPFGSPSPQQPSFVPGMCSFHLDEWESCEEDMTNLYAMIQLYDNDKNLMGETEMDSDTPLGDSINDIDPLEFHSKLPFSLHVTGEHRRDYVQFNYSTLSFTTIDGPCVVGGWDPKHGRCDILTGQITYVKRRQMDCDFPCEA